MDTLISKNGVYKRMKQKPQNRMKMYSFFDGAPILTKAQIVDIEDIVDSDIEGLKAFLKDMKERAAS